MRGKPFDELRTALVELRGVPLTELRHKTPLTRIYQWRPVAFGSCPATGAGSDQARDRSDVSGTRGYTVGSVIKKRR
ncbi:MAG: hypothetical protein K0S98_2628, partial [Propionibacteriaceae bacterium]|nr:hypothetical protein [Propionibacteriaceae bacterium]